MTVRQAAAQFWSIKTYSFT